MPIKCSIGPYKIKLMSKKLNNYVSSQYVGAAQVLRGKKKKRRIVVYVESYDDVFFWRSLLGELETDTTYFEVMLPSRNKLQKGKKSALLSALQSGLGPNMIACVDADYDYLLQGGTAASRLMMSSPYIFHTYVYAIENFQCYAPSLHSVCVMATLNDDHSVFDFEAFLQAYSRIIWPLFVWNVWCYRYGRFQVFSLADFAMAATIGNVNIANPEPALRQLQHKVNSTIARLQRSFPEGRQTYKPFLQSLLDLGLTPETTYLFMRGHDLMDKIVEPIVEHVCAALRRRREREINLLAKHSTQRQNELAGYQHSSASPAEMLRKQNYYSRCPLYKRIQQDVNKILQGEK